jgi:hypothetical protein
MKARPGSIAISLIMIIGLAGCAGGSGPAATPTSAVTSAPAADAQQTFAAATANLVKQSVKFDMGIAGQFTVSGHLDPKSLKAKVSGQMSIDGKGNSLECVVIGDDVWLKIGGIGLDKWMHASADKIKGTTFDLANPVNPAGIMTMINAVNHVEHDGVNGFKGTLDMTKSPTASAEAIAAIGDKLRAVPFTASVHADGNLHTFVIDMSSFVPGAKMTATYSDYGTPLDVQAPPSVEVVEMPARMLASIKS